MQENISKIEKQKKFIIQFLYWLIIIGIIFLLGKIHITRFDSIYNCFYCSWNIK